MKIMLYAETDRGQKLGVIYIKPGLTSNVHVWNYNYIIDFMTDLTEPITDFKLRTWSYTLGVL